MIRIIVLRDDEIEMLKSGEIVLVSSEEGKEVNVMSEDTFNGLMEIRGEQI